MGGNWSSSVVRRSVSLLVVGSPAVGKSALIDSAWKSVYSKYQVKLLSEDTWLVNLPDISLNIADEQDSAFSQSTFRFESIDTCIICFSLVDRRSFRAVKEKWIPLAKSNPDLNIIIVGLKMDKRDELVKQLQQKKKKSPEGTRRSNSAVDNSKTTSTPAPEVIAQLPPEVLQRIFAGLSTRELLNCMQVCKQWKAISSSKYLWKTREWGVPVSTEEGQRLTQDAEAKKYLECCSITGKGVKEVFKEAVKAGVEAVNDRLTLGNRERKEKEAQDLRAKERAKEKEKEKERDAKGKGVATPTKTGSSAEASPVTQSSNVKQP